MNSDKINNEKMSSIDKLTSKDIVKLLDRHIISQDDAKKSVAIALKNRERRKKITDAELSREITPKNVILIGSTGVGKTEIARRLALLVDAPFIKVEATKYTEVGYVGKDVESMIKDLVKLTFDKMRDKKYKELVEKNRENAISRVCAIIRKYHKDQIKQTRTFMVDVRAGLYDDMFIEIEKRQNAPTSHVVEIVGGNLDDADAFSGPMGNIMGAIMSGMPLGMNPKKEKITVKDALATFAEEYAERALNIEELKKEAIYNVENNGIVFIDEIDKTAERSGTDRGNVSRQGVQRDLLPIVEGTTVMTKLGPCKTDHILFIAAGAFTLSSPSDLMPELQGRFPVRVKLKSLEKDDFVKILTSVQYNILDQYKALLTTDKVELIFTQKGIEYMSEVAVDMNENLENIGARRLVTVVEAVLKNVLYEAPFGKPTKITIDVKYIKKALKDEEPAENLDDFIL